MRRFDDKLEEALWRLERLEIIEECQHLMGRYMATHTPAEEHNAWKLYADRPDSSHESFTGYYVGIDAIRAYLAPKDDQHRMFPLEGTFFEHDLCTPTIAVAEDHQTARGVWHSPGVETFGNFDGSAPRSMWCWARYAVDFIKDKGEWKIWHTHFYATFLSPFERSWSEGRALEFDGPQVPGAVSNVYDAHAVFKAIPPAPMPYETFTDDMMRP